MAASDESLMAAYQGGDVAAFEELVNRHERPLWVFLHRFVGDASTAEDLLQEVFLRVVRAGSDWKADAKFSTWLYTIARNLCTDQARRAGHRRTVSLERPRGTGQDEGSGPVLGDTIAAGANVGDGGSVAGGRGGVGVGGAGAGQGEAVAMNRQLGNEIDRAVDALPGDQREVFLMREVMDLPFADIARAVGASEATVKSRMRYALEKLRQSLADFREEDLSPRQGRALTAGDAPTTRGTDRAGKGT